MSKRGRGKFDRKPRDFYPTPGAAVCPLVLHATPLCFVEPCAGDGALLRELEAAGWRCHAAFDIEPGDPAVERRDGTDFDRELLDEWPCLEAVVTNPPYERTALLRLLDMWLGTGLTVWLLLPSDMLMNKWWAPYAPHVWGIIPIGRIKWIEGSKHTSTENFCWVRLERQEYGDRDLDLEPEPFLFPRI